ncbi:YihY/virulence factor BrkB family protein [Zoogloea sp.]|uniref:YihY/virulence factor BrkB family protein n=1 Tax=Zoogloea sp. TaxID=49181 RepID=UPI00262FB4FB|nr:YihY/virulence factor BrkB family protein [Zoogloea sp.]MDD3352026.1 YihY/virulence factor BrkB family protein [Zoogloea sp.]
MSAVPSSLPFVPPRLGASLYPAARLFLARSAPRHGAALAFYAVFSLAPLLVVIMAGVALLMGTGEAQKAIHTYLLRALGESEAQAIMAMTAHALARIRSPGLAAWMAIGTTLVGASAVFMELQAALAAIWGGQAGGSAARRMLTVRLGGLAMALGVGCLLALTLLAEAAMHAALAWFGRGIPGLGVLVGAVDLVLMNGLSAGLFAVLLARLVPARVRWIQAFPAALVVTLLFSGGRYLIAFYLANAGVASAYGAAGSLAAILVWFYWSAQIFLYGACVLRVQAEPVPEEQ